MRDQQEPRRRHVASKSYQTDQSSSIPDSHFDLMVGNQSTSSNLFGNDPDVQHGCGPGNPDTNCRLTCDVCNKTMSAPGVLIEHMKLHSGDSRHVCTICGKGFLKSTHFVGHMNMHHGDRPFSCKYCTKTFNYKSSSIRHEKGCNLRDVWHSNCVGLGRFSFNNGDFSS